MILKTQNFDHEAKHLDDALNFPKSTMKKCKERIIFCSFANYLQGKELYNDEQDIPKSMTTGSGDLQRTLSLIDNQSEFEFTLFTFKNTQSIGKMAISYHRFMSNLGNSGKDRAKAKIMALAADVKLREEAANEGVTDIDMFSPRALVKRLDLVKQSHYDFNIYLNMVSTTDFGEYDTEPSLDDESEDIQDMLNDLFK